MGNTPNTYGKPVFAQTPTQTVADLQAGADYTDTFANTRTGTAAQRSALTSGQMRANMEFRETDTNLRYMRDGTNTNWLLLAAGPAHHAGNPGSAITGVSIPGSAIVLPAGLLIKTGALTSTTSVSFGNEYFPSVTFATAFPSTCLAVAVTALSGSPITNATGNYAVDSVSASAFRAFIQGSSTAYARGFSWIALGY